MIGKKIHGVLYVHRSAVLLLRPNQQQIIMQHAPLEYDIVALGKNFVAYTTCPDWDAVYEPSCGDRTRVDLITGESKSIKTSRTNPLVYHKRHLFVGGDYTGFDMQRDVQRSLSYARYQPDPRRMGRRVWWDNWCLTHGLESTGVKN